MKIEKIQNYIHSFLPSKEEDRNRVSKILYIGLGVIGCLAAWTLLNKYRDFSRYERLLKTDFGKRYFSKNPSSKGKILSKIKQDCQSNAAHIVLKDGGVLKVLETKAEMCQRLGIDTIVNSYW